MQIGNVAANYSLNQGDARVAGIHARILGGELAGELTIRRRFEFPERQTYCFPKERVRSRGRGPCIAGISRERVAIWSTQRIRSGVMAEIVRKSHHNRSIANCGGNASGKPAE